MDDESRLKCPVFGEAVPGRKRLSLHDLDELEEDEQGNIYFRGKRIAFVEPE